MQSCLGGVPQNAVQLSDGSGMERASSTPVQSDACLPLPSMSTISTARSLDRQTSLGKNESKV